MTFDPDEFWGLDEQVVGDGTSDDTTRPISEAVERRMDANNRFLKHLDWKTCLNPFTKNANNISTDGDGLVDNARGLATYMSPWGKAQGSSQIGQFLFAIPVFVHPDTDKFRITMKGNVQSPAEILAGRSKPLVKEVWPDDPNNVTRSVRVRAYIGKGFNPRIPVLSETSGGDFFGARSKLWESNSGPYRIEVDVSRNIQSSQQACLMLSVHTNPSDQAMTPAYDWLQTSSSDFDTLAAWQQHILNIGSGNNTLSVMNDFINLLRDYSVIKVMDNNSHDRYQLTKGSKPDYKMGVQVGDPSPDVEWINTVELGHHLINHIVPQSWTFESFSDKDTPSYTFTDKPKQEMQANQTVNGNDISTHAANIDYNYRKPRLKAIGPKGTAGFSSANNEIDWSQGYNATVNLRWNLVNFSDASGSVTSDNQIERLTFRGDKFASTIRVITQYAVVSYWRILGLIHGTLTGNDAVNTSIEGHFGMRAQSSPKLEDLRLEDGVNIDFGYQVKQRGSSATNEVVSSKVITEDNQEVFVANVRNRFPILRTIFEMFWTDQDRSTMTDPSVEQFEYRAEDFNSEPNFVFREGWLDRFDLGNIVRTVNHTIDIPDDSTTDFDKPFELVSYLDGTSNVQAQYTDGSGTTVNHPDDRIVLVTLQTAVYEEPG